jgi:hypothetical protein
MTSNVEAIRQFANHMRDIVGNLPVLPGIFPDYSAPIVRNAPDGARELAGHAIVASGADGQRQEARGQARGEAQARRFQRASAHGAGRRDDEHPQHGLKALAAVAGARKPLRRAFPQLLGKRRPAERRAGRVTVVLPEPNWPS